MVRKIILLIVIMFLALPAYASVGVKNNGAYLGGVTDINFDTGFNTTSDGSVATVNNYGVKAAYEIFTTGDTLTVADSGKYIITNLADTDGIVDFVLPASTTAGLVYKFVSAKKSIIRIDPAANTSTDQINFASLSQGDRLATGTAAAADGASGDSITLISTGTGWAVSGTNPDNTTWVDAN